MPSGDVQRGSIDNGGGGDPLSPVLPARAELFPGRTIQQVVWSMVKI
jgi:hypothetical protein